MPKSAILFVGDLPADANLFRAMVAAGLQIEGVIAKRKGSTYQPGVRSPAWRRSSAPAGKRVARGKDEFVFWQKADTLLEEKYASLAVPHYLATTPDLLLRDGPLVVHNDQKHQQAVLQRGGGTQQGGVVKE